MAFTKKYVWLAACLLAVGSTVRATEPGGGPSGSVVLDGVSYDVLPVDQLRPMPLPAEFEIQQRIHVRRGEGPVVAGSEPILVYDNTNLDGAIFAPAGANTILADDIETIAAGGCNLQLLDVLVFRPTNAPAPAGFRVTQFAIWDRCPGTPGAAILVDLLDGTPINVTANGGTVLTVDLTGAEIPIPESFWLSLIFNKSDVGWVGGRPTFLGYSRNLLDVGIPGLRCCAIFEDDENPDLHSSLFADVFCAAPVEMTYVGYESRSDTQPDPTFYDGDPCSGGGLGTCGDGVDINSPCETAADDIRPLVPGCRLHAYAMSVVGQAGAFQMEFELFTDDGSNPDGPGAPDVPIPNTRCCFDAQGTGCLEWATCTFDDSVLLPELFWFVWTDDDGEAGPFVAATSADVGESEDGYVVSAGGGTWDPFFFGGCDNPDNECGSFHIRIVCVGQEPVGACCERQSSTCRDEVLNRECGTGNRFQAGVLCETADFDPECGTTACCKVNPSNTSETVCSDEMPTACVSTGGEPVSGEFCGTGEGALDCGNPVCIGAVGDCYTSIGTPGCSNNKCCSDVCAIDPACCDPEQPAGWDGICAEEAMLLCPDLPPSNDACVDATAVSEGATPFNTTNAVTDGAQLPDECLSSNSLVLGNDVWFKHRPTMDGDMTLSFCSIANDYDTRVAVYEGLECPPAHLIGCDDDGCNILGRFVSLLTVPVTANTDYLIRVGGWGDSESGLGEMSLMVTPSDCPDETVAFFDPAAGAVDARMMSATGGLNVFHMDGPPNAEPTMCFDLCETDDEGNPNMIQSVIEAPQGATSRYTINLRRTITLGGVTSLIYGAAPDLQSARFVFQPGNVNGINGVNSADADAMLTCLDGNLAPCPWGMLSTDLDHSERFNPQDMIGLVNVLMESSGQPQPSPAGCP